MPFSPQLRRTLLPTDNIRYTAKYANAYRFPDDPQNDDAHIHHYYELYFNLSGEVSFLVNNHIYPIKRGDIIFTRPEDVHLCIYQAPCYHKHFCLWIDASADSPLVNFTHQPDFCNFLSVPEETIGHFAGLLHKLSYEEDPERSLLSRTALLCEIMNYIQHNCHYREDLVSPSMPDEMQQLLTYMNNHFNEIQHIKDVYDLVYISPATLNRWFRKYIHLSPREFLESKKLAYAKQLLNQGFTVTEASIQSGFADSSYFISVFKKKFGVTPGIYKQEMYGAGER
ncbi:MAG: helix-turn-helix domain-containing protein [Lachnospiraceae bacterium]|nr:helix-turn-helix domain-containing protein [Lachnospiraceae bacterium]